MTDPREVDSGCLSVLSSCFKKRGKPRPGAAESPNQVTPLVSSATEVTELSLLNPTCDGISASTNHEIQLTASLQAGSSAPSAAVIEDRAASITPTTDQGSATTDYAATTLDLWQEAYDKVDEKTRKWIDSIPSAAHAKDPAKELVELVRFREEKHEKEARKLKIGGRVILWRDYASRVISLLTAIGDIAVTVAPAPSSTVWSAVKVLLKGNVSELEDLVAIMGCTDIVLCLVRRGIVYEEVYITESPRPPAQEDLKQKLVEVYSDCLEFLAFVDGELQHGNMRRFLDALLDPGCGDKRVSAVKALEQKLQAAAQACEAKASSEHRTLVQSLEWPIKRVDDNVAAVLEKLGDEDKKNAMTYISTVPVGVHHNEKREKRAKDTCEWLILHSQFLKWEESACSSVLWLQGNIGTGKSFLASKVIDRYWAQSRNDSQPPNEKNDEGVAFFYCNSSDTTRHSIHSVLRSYIRQLCEVTRDRKSVHRAVVDLYNKKAGIQSDITMEDCEIALIEMINSYPRTVLILDALDECSKETRRKLVEIFKRLVEKSNRLLKIFITSRPEYDVHCYMRSFRGPQTMITVSTLDNRGDIKMFVDAEVDNFPADWKFETKQLVKSMLVDKSDGMFRWTYLQWEQLKNFSTNGGVKQRLGKLPKTLMGAYDEIYDRYDPDGVECFLMQRVVRWVMCARQPLESRALLAAIRIESEEAGGEQALDKSDLTEPILEAVCRHLVVRDPKLGIWNFPHASVAEYFRAKSDSWVKDAEGEVTVILTNCLIDFCSSVWPMKCTMNAETVVELPNWLEARRAAPKHTLDPWHPLHGYIIRNWLQHIRNMTLGDSSAVDVVQALKRFLCEESPRQSSWEYRAFCLIVMSGPDWTYDNSSGNYMRNSVDPYDNPAFGVVTFGLHRLLAGWWDKNVDISSLVNAEGSDLLAIAAYLGYTDLCEYLIHQGCDMNKDAKFTCHSALGASIHQQKIGTMKLLLENGANPDRVINHHSLLCLAMEKGVDYCILLLEKGADPNIECPRRSCFRFESAFGLKHCLRRAMSKAAYNGNFSVMKALVDNGADVNPENLRDLDGSPLAAAAYMGEIECARLLIAKGADVNAQLKYTDFGSPLTASVSNGKLECARILVEHGADVNMNPKFGPYGSPLAAAVSMGQLDCARFLVESGANVNAYLEFGEYGSVLAAAILGTRPVLDIIQFLVEEQQAGPAQLVFMRPRGKNGGRIRKRSSKRISYDQKLGRSIAAYLMQKLEIEPQMLISLGVPREDVAPDVALEHSSQGN